jgi:hypothetical protein
LDDRLESIQETLGQLQSEIKRESKPLDEANTLKLVSARVDEAIRAAFLTDKPVYFLTVAPVNAVEIPSIFEAKSEVTQTLNAPPEIRRAGFDLNTEENSRLIRGELRRAVIPGKLLELWRDGTLIFVAQGDYDFLSWGKYAKPGARFRINPIVLIESIYLFVELSKTIFQYSEPKANGFTFCLGLANMCLEKQPCYLIPGEVGSFGWEYGSSGHDAPECSHSFSIQFTKELDSGEVAYALVREVYRWFAFEDDKIPYTEMRGDRPIISVDKLKTLR